jgi:ABC-type dipeptide/oligopeptide/nickel transport system permease component
MSPAIYSSRSRSKRPSTAARCLSIGVVYGHALRNSLLPIITILSPLLAAVLTGTFVVEWVFAVPGRDDAFVTSVTTRDYNLLVSVTVLYSIFLVIANALVDGVYVWLDPRIRLQLIISAHTCRICHIYSGRVLPGKGCAT